MIREDTRKDENKIYFISHILNSSHTLKYNTKDQFLN